MFTLRHQFRSPSTPIPVSVEASADGAVGDGYFSTAETGPVSVTCELTWAPDLLTSDWTPDHGNDLYVHLADE